MATKLSNISSYNQFSIEITKSESIELDENSSLKNSMLLHQSIMDGRLTQVKYLIKMGCKVDSRDKFGRTCLMLAALCEHEQYGYTVSKLLLKYGADLNIQDYLGRTAVSIACCQKREKLVGLFIDQHSASINFNLKDNDGDGLLNHAATYGTPTMVRKIAAKMKRHYVSIDQRNTMGYTALLLASKYKKYMNAYVLLTEAGASPFLRDNEYFCNALEWIIGDNANVNELMLNIRGENRGENTKANLLRSSDVKFNCSQSVDPRSLFAANKSKSSLTSFNSGSQVTYKSWYNLPNQYFDSATSKCDHVPAINYLVDYNNSTFIPAILTPRIDLHNKNELNFINKKDDTAEDIGVLYKLVDKLKEKMTNSSSFLIAAAQSSCSIYPNDKETVASTINTNEHHRTTGGTSASHRSNILSASSHTVTYMSHPLSKTFITQRQESELPIIQKVSAPRLLAHEGRSKTTIKDGIPKIFECYTGENRTLNIGFRNKSAYKSQKSDNSTDLSHHLNKKTGIVKSKFNRDAASKDVKKEVTFNLDS